MKLLTALLACAVTSAHALAAAPVPPRAPDLRQAVREAQFGRVPAPRQLTAAELAELRRQLGESQPPEPRTPPAEERRSRRGAAGAAGAAGARTMAP
jgi:hypothetical protein